MNVEVKSYGTLECVVVDSLPTGRHARALAIFCHGFGAGGRDLVPLAPELLELEPQLADAVRFVFPAAPLAPAEFAMFGGRAWWPLDVASLTEAIERGELRDQRTYFPVELPEVRRDMLALVEEATDDAKLPSSHVVLGGFSQGSMVAVDAALHLPQAPLGVCVYSGTLLCESEWKSLAAARSGLNVLQSHGRQDPILPFEAAVWLRDMFIAAGANVEFVAFPGQHTIPAAVMHKTAAALLSWLESHRD